MGYSSILDTLIGISTWRLTEMSGNLVRSPNKAEREKIGWRVYSRLDSLSLDSLSLDSLSLDSLCLDSLPFDFPLPNPTSRSRSLFYGLTSSRLTSSRTSHSLPRLSTCRRLGLRPNFLLPRASPARAFLLLDFSPGPRAHRRGKLPKPGVCGLRNDFRRPLN